MESLHSWFHGQLKPLISDNTELLLKQLLYLWNTIIVLNKIVGCNFITSNFNNKIIVCCKKKTVIALVPISSFKIKQKNKEKVKKKNSLRKINFFFIHHLVRNLISLDNVISERRRIQRFVRYCRFEMVFSFKSFLSKISV